MRPKVLLSVIAVLNLVTGAIFGVAIDRVSTRPVALEHCPATIDGKDVDIVRLADVLELQGDKDARVGAILASCRPRLDAVMRDVRPRLEALHREFLGELGVELTPAQLSRLAAEYHRQASGEGR